MPGGARPSRIGCKPDGVPASVAQGVPAAGDPNSAVEGNLVLFFRTAKLSQKVCPIWRVGNQFFQVGPVALCGNSWHGGVQHRQCKRKGLGPITWKAGNDESRDQHRRIMSTPGPHGLCVGNPPNCRAGNGRLLIGVGFQSSDRSRQTQTTGNLRHRESQASDRYGEHSDEGAKCVASR